MTGTKIGITTCSGDLAELVASSFWGVNPSIVDGRMSLNCYVGNHRMSVRGWWGYWVGEKKVQAKGMAFVKCIPLFFPFSLLL